jgi:hypothetical protein
MILDQSLICMELCRAEAALIEIGMQIVNSVPTFGSLSITNFAPYGASSF